jgi:hypothetical protein
MEMALGPLCGPDDIVTREMPSEKTNITGNPVDYHEFYDDETKTKIAECFAREIKLFNYQF